MAHMVHISWYTAKSVFFPTSGFVFIFDTCHLTRGVFVYVHKSFLKGYLYLTVFTDGFDRDGGSDRGLWVSWLELNNGL